MDDEDYQRQLAAQRRAAYAQEHAGYLRMSLADRAKAVEKAVEAEFGEPLKTQMPAKRTAARASSAPKSAA